MKTRTLFFAVSSLLLSISSIAQSDSSLSKRISKDFCDEFEKIKANITKENMEMQVGLLILPLLSKHMEDIKKEWKLDPSNQGDLEKIGRKIGEQAAMACPAFQNFIMNNISAIVDNDKSGHKDDETLWASGTIQKIEGQPFAYVTVKRTNGKTEKLYWMEYFEGADKLIGDIKKYSNQTVIFGYKEIEVYDPLIKEYKKIKVITEFEDDVPPPPPPSRPPSKN